MDIHQKSMVLMLSRSKLLTQNLPLGPSFISLLQSHNLELRLSPLPPPLRERGG